MLRTFLLAGAGLLAGAATAQQLPDDIAASKVVRVAVNAGYVPMEMRDEKTGELIGFDIDLGAALAEVLGVKLDYQDGAFEAMTPALQSGRVDMIMSGFYDTEKRRETFDFVDYLKAGGQFFALTSSDTLNAPTDLCGLTVSTIRGTSYEQVIKDFSDKECVGAGKPAMKVASENDPTQILVNLKTGRVDAGVQGIESIPTLMGVEPNTYKTIGEPLSVNLMGMAFQKEATQLRDSFHAALKTVIEDGTYDEIVQKWKLDLSSYKDATINGAPAQ